MEVSGDGIIDYVIQDTGGTRAIRSSGLSEVDDVKLPDNFNQAITRSKSKSVTRSYFPGQLT